LRQMRELRRRIGKVRKLDPSERRFVLCACFAAPVFSAALRLIGLRRLQALNAATEGRAARPMDSDQLARKLALASIALSMLPVRTSCLARALTFQWLLNRDGIFAQLRIGARFVDRQLDAHAWLEFQGQPITDRPEALRQFAALETCAPRRAHSV
jgi:hypothetical protein